MNQVLVAGCPLPDTRPLPCSSQNVPAAAPAPQIWLVVHRANASFTGLPGVLVTNATTLPMTHDTPNQQTPTVHPPPVASSSATSISTRVLSQSLANAPLFVPAMACSSASLAALRLASAAEPSLPSLLLLLSLLLLGVVLLLAGAPSEVMAAASLIRVDSATTTAAESATVMGAGSTSTSASSWGAACSRALRLACCSGDKQLTLGAAEVTSMGRAAEKPPKTQATAAGIGTLCCHR